MSYFSGLRILITGAGSGIGKLMAEKLAQSGAHVIVTARRLPAAEEVAHDINHRGGIATAMKLDVSKINTIPAFYEELHKKTGAIDILINNAGIVHGGNFEEVELKQHINTFQTNTLGLMAMCHTFMPDLAKSRKGHIVNIASASAFVGLPYGSTYAASKWAVLGFSESLRLEMHERGIENLSVTTVCPGYIDTGMFNGVSSPALTPMLTPEKVVNETLRAIKKKEAVLMLPLIANSMELLKGVLPRWAWDQVAKRMGVSTSMESWKGKH